MKKFVKAFFSSILIICLCFGGYNFLIKKQIINLQEEKEEVIQVACVGDSLTFWRAYEDEKFVNYPATLQQLLGDGYDVTNYGEAGTCVRTDGYYPYKSLRVYRCSIESNSDIVVIMIGTNDIWDVNWIDEDSFRKEYIELVDSYMQGDKLPELYLCTIPKIFLPDGTTLETGSGERIEKLSKVIKEVANEKGYNLIDMNQITSQHPEWYWEDLVHFSNEGAKNVAKVVEAAIRD